MRYGYFMMPMHPPGSYPGGHARARPRGRSSAWTSWASTRPGSASTSPPSGRTSRRRRSFIAAALQRTKQIELGHRRHLHAEPQPVHPGPPHRPARPDGAGPVHVGRRLRRLHRRFRDGGIDPSTRHPAQDHRSTPSTRCSSSGTSPSRAPTSSTTGRTPSRARSDDRPSTSTSSRSSSRTRPSPWPASPRSPTRSAWPASAAGSR